MVFKSTAPKFKFQFQVQDPEGKWVPFQGPMLGEMPVQLYPALEVIHQLVWVDLRNDGYAWPENSYQVRQMVQSTDGGWMEGEWWYTYSWDDQEWIAHILPEDEERLYGGEITQADLEKWIGGEVPVIHV